MLLCLFRALLGRTSRAIIDVHAPNHIHLPINLSLLMRNVQATQFEPFIG